MSSNGATFNGLEKPKLSLFSFSKHSSPLLAPKSFSKLDRQLICVRAHKGCVANHQMVANASCPAAAHSWADKDQQWSLAL